MDLSFALTDDVDAKIEHPDWPEWFARQARMVESGVASVGDPSAYALVWEWGNLRQYHKGPHTVLGDNPAGGRGWMSTQAPHGWIAINEPQMWDIVDRHMAQFTLADNAESGMAAQFEQLSLDISRDCLKLLKSTVPVETGALEESLEIVEPGDGLLDTVEDSFGDMEGGTTDFGGTLIDMNYPSSLNE